MGRSALKIGGLLVSTFILSSSILAQSKAPVIVGITVDQMKAEYLTRFDEHFKHGFRRLIDGGAIFRNTHYSHVPTYTAPGHATIYTGAQPSAHGIIGNDWYDPFTKEGVYCVGDNSVNSVGSESDAGQMSPRNLLTTTFTDELKLNSNNQSYVGSVSIKDRGAILPAGHNPDEAYWFSPGDGFITSTYYTNQLPDWVSSFNEEHSNLSEYAQTWDYFIDSSAYSSCLPNSNHYEADLGRRGHTGFPLNVPALIESQGPGIIRVSPWGNTLVTDFALEMMRNIPNEQLEDEYTDAIAISYSSTDYIGHAFGPRSREVMDTYLRLDVELGRLMDALDEKFGEGNYILFLTADHAVAENPTHLNESLGITAKSHTGADIQELLNQKALNKLGFDAIEKLSNDQVFLDLEALAEHEMTIEDASQKLKEAWADIDFIRAIYTRSDIISNSSYEAQLRKSGLDRRSGHLFLQWNDGHLIYGTTGSSHGSGYTYDTHVPMMLYGQGIKAMNVYRKTHVVDLAPTITFLVGIPLPHSAYSQPLLEVL